MKRLVALAVTLALVPTLARAEMNPAQKQIFETYVSAAKAAAGFDAPSIERGRAFFMATHTGGKADSPSCTSCHGTDPTRPGKSLAGKVIDPMAASVAPARYTDPATVDKWFKRNCASVLGRECSAAEKADVLAYFLSL